MKRKWELIGEEEMDVCFNESTTNIGVVVFMLVLGE